MDNILTLTILNGAIQILKLSITVHGFALLIHHGEFISHKTAHGLKVHSQQEVKWY
jgi:hypothetical protein